MSESKEKREEKIIKELVFLQVFERLVFFIIIIRKIVTSNFSTFVKFFYLYYWVFF